MKKIAIIIFVLLVSCETTSNSETYIDSSTFDKNVQTLKNNFVQGYIEEDFDKVISIFADSIKWYGPGVNSEMVEGIDILKENVTFWMDNFEDISFTEGGGLPGTDVGFWGGNTYPVSQAMSGQNNVRMYGTWNVTNSNTGKNVSFKHYLVWNFNEDGKVHTVTEYADVGGLLSTFNE
ncbi:MAG: nuclear transport factor 2 family protein [Bacteroidota bacterium]